MVENKLYIYTHVPALILSIEKNSKKIFAKATNKQRERRRIKKRRMLVGQAKKKTKDTRPMWKGRKRITGVILLCGDKLI